MKDDREYLQKLIAEATEKARDIDARLEFLRNEASKLSFESLEFFGLLEEVECPAAEKMIDVLALATKNDALKEAIEMLRARRETLDAPLPDWTAIVPLTNPNHHDYELDQVAVKDPEGKRQKSLIPLFEEESNLFFRYDGSRGNNMPERRGSFREATRLAIPAEIEIFAQTAKIEETELGTRLRTAREKKSGA